MKNLKRLSRRDLLKLSTAVSLALVLSACSPAPTPTPMAAPTATPMVTSTPIPTPVNTPTPAPTATSLPPTLRELADKIGVKIGVGVDEYDDFRNTKYQESLGTHFSSVFPTGAFMRTYLDRRGPSSAQAFRSIATKYQQILYIHPGYWHLDVPEYLKKASREEVIKQMGEYARFNLDFVQKVDEGYQPTYINFINEPWWADPPNKPINVGWLESPYYQVYGENLITEAYLIYVSEAEKAGLKVDKDFRLIVSVDGIFFPNKKLDFALGELIKAKRAIAKRLGVPLAQVQLDLAMQWRFDARVTGLKASPEGMYKLPTEDELVESLNRAKNLAEGEGVSLPVHITEFGIVGVSDDQQTELLRRFTRIAISYGVKSVTYGGMLCSPRNPGFEDRYNLFDVNYNPTDDYRLLLEDF